MQRGQNGTGRERSATERRNKRTRGEEGAERGREPEVVGQHEEAGQRSGGEAQRSKKVALAPEQFTERRRSGSDGDDEGSDETGDGARRAHGRTRGGRRAAETELDMAGRGKPRMVRACTGEEGAARSKRRMDEEKAVRGETRCTRDTYFFSSELLSRANGALVCPWPAIFGPVRRRRTIQRGGLLGHAAAADRHPGVAPRPPAPRSVWLPHIHD